MVACAHVTCHQCECGACAIRQVALDAAVKRIAELEAERTRLRSLVARLVDLAQWMTGSRDFDVFGNWREGRALCDEATAELKGGG